MRIQIEIPVMVSLEVERTPDGYYKATANIDQRFVEVSCTDKDARTAAGEALRLFKQGNTLVSIDKLFE